MDILQKRCFKCNLIKEINSFYKQKGMSDGYLNKCKDCTKKDISNRIQELRNDDEWVEKERERNRDKYYRLFYKNKFKPTRERKKETIRKYHQKFPEKYLASKYTEIYLIKKSGYNLHHWSYNEKHWLDIIELTIKDHNFIHRFLIYDIDTKFYKDLDGTLLDTKEKHLNYLQYCKENY